jgi:hypothetical protein
LELNPIIHGQIISLFTPKMKFCIIVECVITFEEILSHQTITFGLGKTKKEKKFFLIVFMLDRYKKERVPKNTRIFIISPIS